MQKPYNSWSTYKNVLEGVRQYFPKEMQVYLFTDSLVRIADRRPKWNYECSRDVLPEIKKRNKNLALSSFGTSSKTILQNNKKITLQIECP